MNKVSNFKLLTTLTLSLGLVACNGGSSSSDEPIPPATYSISFVTPDNITTNSTFNATVSVTSNSMSTPSSVQVTFTDVSTDKTKIICNSPATITPNISTNITCTTPNINDAASIGSHQMQAFIIGGSAVDQHNIYIKASGTIGIDVESAIIPANGIFKITLTPNNSAYGEYIVGSRAADGAMFANNIRKTCDFKTSKTSCTLDFQVESSAKIGNIFVAKNGDSSYSNFTDTESIAILIPITIE